MAGGLLHPGGVAACAACAVVVVGLGSARADVLLDFDVQSEYDNNFTELRFGAQNGWVASSGNTPAVDATFGAYVRSITSATHTLTRYDTNQGDGGAKGPTDILGETIGMDFWTDALRSTDPTILGLITRIQSNDRGVQALLFFQGTTSLRVQLNYGGLYNATSNGTGSVVFYDATFDLAANSVTNTTGTGGTSSTNALAASGYNFTTNLWNTINPYHISLAQTTGDDPTFNVTVTDAQGLVASTGSVALTATEAYNTAGSVGIRLGNNGGTLRHGYDNFAITAVPEPMSFASLGLGGLTFMRRRRA